MVSEQMLYITNQMFPFRIKRRIKNVFPKDVESKEAADQIARIYWLISAFASVYGTNLFSRDMANIEIFTI